MSDFDLVPGATRKSVPATKPSKKVDVLPTTPTLTEETLSNDAPSAAEKPEYSQEELLQIFDEILFSNEYTESFSILNRLKVTFKTRTAQEIQDINMTLDGMGASLISTVDGVRAMMNLESALATYQGKDLASMKKDDRTAFIGKLPGPIVGALMMALAKFDRKVALACQEGELNF